jgi:hypothetical protein
MARIHILNDALCIPNLILFLLTRKETHMASYMPSKDDALNTWAKNFSALISASPGTYGLMAADASAIATQVNLFSAALTLAKNPATKTKSTVADKNGKRAAMKQVIRQYAAMIKQNQGISDAAKTDLGLIVSAAIHTVTPPPSMAPVLALSSDGAMHQKVAISDSTDPKRKAKPAGVQGVVLLAYVGAGTAPATPDQANFKRLATRRTAPLVYGSADVGKLATVWGAYYNPAGELGPMSSPVSLLITG